MRKDTREQIEADRNSQTCFSVATVVVEVVVFSPWNKRKQGATESRWSAAAVAAARPVEVELTIVVAVKLIELHKT